MFASYLNIDIFLGIEIMNNKSSVNLQTENLSTSLKVLRNSRQKFLAEYEAKVALARVQLAHVEALLQGLPIEKLASQPNTTSLKNNNGNRREALSSKPLNAKRPSLFGSDKDKIVIGKRFDETLREFQDYV